MAAEHSFADRNPAEVVPSVESIIAVLQAVERDLGSYVAVASAKASLDACVRFLESHALKVEFVGV